MKIYTVSFKCLLKYLYKTNVTTPSITDFIKLNGATASATNEKRLWIEPRRYVESSVVVSMRIPKDMLRDLDQAAEDKLTKG